MAEFYASGELAGKDVPAEVVFSEVEANIQVSSWPSASSSTFGYNGDGLSHYYPRVILHDTNIDRAYVRMEKQTGRVAVSGAWPQFPHTAGRRPVGPSVISQAPAASVSRRNCRWRMVVSEGLVGSRSIYMRGVNSCPVRWTRAKACLHMDSYHAGSTTPCSWRGRG